MARRGKTTERVTAQGRRINRLIREMRRSPHVKVGFPLEREADHIDSEDLTVAEVAIFQEFGTANGIPERRPIRTSFDDNLQGNVSFQKKIFKALIDGLISLTQALDLLGLKMSSQQKETIGSNLPPPNAESTIRAKTVGGKKGNKTLIDTGQMINSVTYVKIE